MAVYQFSALSDGQSISFNPASDILNFDQPAIAAADLRVVTEGSNIHINLVSGTSSGKDVVLLSTAQPQLATSNITFADGSKLLFGDNTAAQTADNSANSLTGTAGHDLLEGFGGSDTLTGGAGNDVLDGGTQFDRLVGGTGNDTFLFSVAATGANADLIVDFVSGTDKIALDTTIYTNAGALGDFAAGDGRFYAAAGATSGHDANDRVIYNTTNGTLWYDADGSGSGASQLIATLQGAPALTAADITVASSSAPAGGGGGGGSTINGTAGDDTLTGTDANDTINGLAGNDIMSGAGGNDSLLGGTGNDNLDGGDGNDALIGGDGNDQLSGGPGIDTLEGGLGDDIYFRPTSEDVIRPEAGGHDSVFTENSWTLAAGFEELEVHGFAGFSYSAIGNDLDNHIQGMTPGATYLLSGLGGNDSLFGSDGNDTLLGGSGNDNLGGVGGDDYLDGGLGNDTLLGHDGADTFALTAAAGNANADEILDFVSGTDTLQLDARAMTALGVSGRFSATDGRFYAAPGAVSGHDADDRLILNTSTGQLLYDADGSGPGAAQWIAAMRFSSTLAASDIEVINGTGGGNAINGTAGNDTLNGTAGNDTINGLAGNDSLIGNAGNDSLVGGPGDDTMLGGDGNDTLDGQDGGVDTFDGGAGIDTQIASFSGTAGAGIENLIVRGYDPGLGADAHGNELDNRITDEGSGTVFLYGHAGNDTLIGGAGVNFLVFENNYGKDSVDGGGGSDELLFEGVARPVLVDFRNGTASGGSDTLSDGVTFVNVERAIGGAADDTLYAGPNGNALGGYSGNDTLVGGAGNDNLFGDSGFDHPSPSPGNDVLLGLGGNDTLGGEEGDDSLDGGTGNDQLFGGPNADIFAFSAAPGAANADQIADFTSSSDKIQLDGTAHANSGPSGNFAEGDARFWSSTTGTAHDATDRVLYNTSTGELWYDADGNGSGGRQLIATAQGAPALTATDIVITNGAGGGQAINGTSGNDNLNGGTGNDTINGLGGNDQLYGDPIDAANQGNDSISGGDGDDLLQGYGGNDTLLGGAGNDFIVIDTSNNSFPNIYPGNDSIDGGTGIDQVGFSTEGVSTTGAVTIDLAAGTYSIADSRGQINGTVLNVENVQTSLFADSVRGSEVANWIDAFGGDDTVFGLGGNDTINGSIGNDSISGGDGDDLIVDDESAFFQPGNDTLDGGAGTDTMDGSLGNDTYYVTSGDVVQDSGGGIDTIISAVSWSLSVASNVENLTLQGTGAITAAGNALDNILTGNDASNGSINGRAGNDTMFGMGGNDVFDMSTGGTSSYGNDSIDGGAGTDTVDFGVNARSGVTANLGAGTMSGGGDAGAGSATLVSIENFIGGSLNDSLTGSAVANALTGAAGNDTLNGGAGADRLTGGSGNDHFVFANAGNANADLVADFATGVDKLDLENGVYTAIGAAGNFAAGDARFYSAAGATAGHDANDRVVYNTTTGNLYYDADGSGSGVAQLVATIQGHPAVAATDIGVI